MLRFFSIAVATLLCFKASAQEFKKERRDLGSAFRDPPINHYRPIVAAEHGCSGVDSIASGIESHLYPHPALFPKCKDCSFPFSIERLDANEELSFTSETDVLRSLAGHVSGAQILGRPSSALSDLTSIRFRGFLSFSESAPLLVVDGTPINWNESIRPNVDLGINIDNLQSVTILKPPVASSLFGVRGGSGVILITSKRSETTSNIGIELTSTFLVESVYKLPDYQNVYAGGRDSKLRVFTWREGNPAEWKVLDGKKYHDYSSDASWGPRMDGSQYIPWYAWYPGHGRSFRTALLTRQPGNIGDLYQPGVLSQNNLRFYKRMDGYAINIAYGNIYQSGVRPGEQLNRNYFNVNTDTEIVRSLELTGNFNIMSENFEEKGDIEKSMFPLHGFHRDLDMKVLKELSTFLTPTGTLASWNHPNPDAASNFGAAVFNQAVSLYNPFSYWANSSIFGDANRRWGDVTLSWHPLSHLLIFGSVRTNTLASSTQSRTSSLLADSGSQTGTVSQYMSVRKAQAESTVELSTQFSTNWKSLRFSFVAGGSLLQHRTDAEAMMTRGGLLIPDLYLIQNSKEPPSILNYRRARRLNSLYSSIEVNIDSIFSIYFSGRSDLSSGASFRSDFFPAAGISFSPQEYFRKSTPLIISDFKLRFSYGQSGHDLESFEFNRLFNQPLGYDLSALMMTIPDVLLPINLQTPKTVGGEGGLDIGFFKDRLLVGITLYRNVKRNELIPLESSATSGYTSMMKNQGRLESRGAELLVTLARIKMGGFMVDFSFAFSKNRSQITSLGRGVKSIGDFYADSPDSKYAKLAYVVNGGDEKIATGQIVGRGIRRINGVPVLNDDGTFQFDEDVLFGSFLPRSTGGAFQSLSFKRFVLQYRFDFQFGGKYFFGSHYFADYLGLSRETAAVNNLGKNVRDPVSEGGGVHVTGVNENGSAVDYDIEGYAYFRQFAENRIIDNGIFDASFVKFREIVIGYEIKLQNRFALKKLTINVIGRNPWLIYSARRDLDSGETFRPLGELNQLPSSRSFGVRLKLVL